MLHSLCAVLLLIYILFESIHKDVEECLLSKSFRCLIWLTFPQKGASKCEEFPCILISLINPLCYHGRCSSVIFCISQLFQKYKYLNLYEGSYFLLSGHFFFIGPGIFDYTILKFIISSITLIHSALLPSQVQVLSTIISLEASGLKVLALI